MKDSDITRNTLYRFAFSKILVITLFAILCSCLVISAANDLFAFVKPSRDYTVEIPSQSSITDISNILQRRGVIENSLGFLIYVGLKGHNDTLRDFQGTLELNSDMSYGEILNEFIYFD